MAKILVVEDMKPIQLLLNKRLIKNGHEVLIAGNGKEALVEVLSHDDIELILLDIMMPISSGINFLEENYNECKERGIKICMLTALDNNENIQKCLSLGASDYLIKPIDNELLCEKVDSLLQGNSNVRFAAINTSIAIDLEFDGKNGDGEMIVLSENKAIFKSTSSLEVGTIIKLSSTCLNNLIGEDFTTASRVVSFKKEKKGFAYLVEFIGLSELKTKKIRSLTVRGEEIKLT